jgi:hypothetical protein
MLISPTALEHLTRAEIPDNRETGGILGSYDNTGVVTHIAFDYDDYSLYPCEYRPHINYFNLCIEQWYKHRIQFIGFFHTHLHDVDSLSQGDILYINVIMNSMPQGIDSLYFPLYVLPSRKLKGYKATRQNGSVEIVEEQVYVAPSYY